MDTAIATPLRNLENEEMRILDEKIFEPEVCIKEDPIISENPPEKTQIKTPVFINKNITIKRVTLKTITGEKRKFPYVSEPVKIIKRVKPEEDKVAKKTPPSKEKTQSKFTKNEMTPSTPDVIVLSPQATQDKEDCILIENDSDAENKSQVKQKSNQLSSRKSKAIGNECRETYGKLLTFSAETLTAMEKTLNILKTNNLLNNKYVSTDTLMELIILALDASKTDVEKESILGEIVTKRSKELCVNPKGVKAKKNILTAANPNPEAVPENVEGSTSVQEDGIIKTEPVKPINDEKNAEQNEVTIIEYPEEKNQEPSIEKSGKNFCITNYFKKFKKNVAERDKNERFSLFSAKTDMVLAPKLGGKLTEERRKIFEEEFDKQTHESDYLLECLSNRKRNKREKKLKDKQIKRKTPIKTETSKSDEAVEVPESESSGRKRVSLIKVEVPKSETVEMVSRGKAKLFQFHDNRRPPYWGTWRKKSQSVGARRPFGKEKTFNYEIDSDDEWEEEEEGGESLHGSDDEKEPEEDYEVDNDFFVPHGYLSDDENPEKENLSPKTKLNLLEEQFTLELKEKTRKMTPFVFGCFWLYKGIQSTGTLYQDLQIESLQYRPWVEGRVEIPEKDEIKCGTNSEQSEPTSQTKKLLQKTFPEEEIPNLIKMIHESPKNCGHLARKFLLYWEGEKIQDEIRPRLTKVCVQKKIKELAAWQSSSESGKMCWYVPKTTREEFKADVETKSPEKKAQKCFIWKFVRKAEKFPGGGTASVSVPTPRPAPDSEVVVLE